MKSKRHTRKVHRRHRGGGYGFGGSILSDVGGAGAGNVNWVSDTGKDCGALAGRAGNDLTGGRRRRVSRKGGMLSNAQLADRGGQNKMGGRRRGGQHKMMTRTKTKKRDEETRKEIDAMYKAIEKRAAAPAPRRSARLTKKGGAYVDYAQQAPRTGYGFNGQGVAGTSDTIPY